MNFETDHEHPVRGNTIVKVIVAIIVVSIVTGIAYYFAFGSGHPNFVALLNRPATINDVLTALIFSLSISLGIGSIRKK
jgi:hypothetical protein